MKYWSKQQASGPSLGSPAARRRPKPGLSPPWRLPGAGLRPERQRGSSDTHGGRSGRWHARPLSRWCVCASPRSGVEVTTAWWREDDPADLFPLVTALGSSASPCGLRRPHSSARASPQPVGGKPRLAPRSLGVRSALRDAGLGSGWPGGGWGALCPRLQARFSESRAVFT